MEFLNIWIPTFEYILVDSYTLLGKSVNITVYFWNKKNDCLQLWHGTTDFKIFYFQLYFICWKNIRSLTFGKEFSNYAFLEQEEQWLWYKTIGFHNIWNTTSANIMEDCKIINKINKVLFRVDTYHNIHKTQALQSFSNRLYI